MAEFDRLRELLLSQEQSRLDAIEARQGELPQRLPELLEESARKRGNERVAKAIGTPVAIALAAAVKNNPQSLVDALFPIIGPAIRRSIAEALRDFSEGFNSALESSFTPKGIGWRIEAWRSGLSYAQVVLQHTLKFHIDHLFLIERESGLVLHRESAPDRADLDADAIAGMLTAIGDFVRDSVGRGGGSLASATVGEHLLWVIEGPRANLAAFIRGVPPAHLRVLLEERLEHLHEALADPNRGLLAGAADAGEAFAHDLRLREIEQTAAAQAEPAPKPSRRWPYVLVGVIALAGLTTWIVRQQMWKSRAEVTIERLAKEPGYLLTRIDSQPWRSLEFIGLRDPDAAPPERLLEGAPIDPKLIHFDLRPMISTEPRVTATRARRLLQPPAGVELNVDTKGVLHLRGIASNAWVASTVDHASWITGVDGVDSEGLSVAVDPVAQARHQLRTLQPTIEALFVSFDHDAVPAEPGTLDGLIVELKQARRLAQTAQWPLRIATYGDNDANGNDSLNRALRRARAEWLGARLRGAGLGEIGVDDEAGGTLARRAAAVRLTIDDKDAVSP